RNARNYEGRDLPTRPEHAILHSVGWKIHSSYKSFVKKIRKGVLVNVRTLLLIVLLFQAAAYAQSVHGTVTDAAHIPISQATVQITQDETNRQRSAVTGMLGELTISNLPPGQYRVEVDVECFRKHVQQITLQLNQDATLEISLLPGRRTETVEVTAVRSLLRTESAA